MKWALAIDIGASGGRVLAGTVIDHHLNICPVRQFTHQGTFLRKHWYWNVIGLFTEITTTIAEVTRTNPNDEWTLGIDTWGVDYVLLDDRKEPLGLPVMYRDRRTDGVPERIWNTQISREEIFFRTGIQHMPINTLYQLASLQGSSQLSAARHLLLMADFFNYLLCGMMATEETIASTTQLYDSRAHQWDNELIKRVGLSTAMFPPLVETGTRLGAMDEGRGSVEVIAVAGHDTGSAVAAIPLGPHDAYLVSGTWSLLGVETRRPIIEKWTYEDNVTNEVGVWGSIRLLKNVMGLWLLQRCIMAWEQETGGALDLPALIEQSKAYTDPPLIDPDHPGLLFPQNMPRTIGDLCRACGQKPPDQPAEMVSTIFMSLAMKYRWLMERLQNNLGRRFERLFIVGGGSRNGVLNQITADASGIPVWAGLPQASALGNLGVQLIADGQLSDLTAFRAQILADTPWKVFHPQTDRTVQYARFLNTCLPSRN